MKKTIVAFLFVLLLSSVITAPRGYALSQWRTNIPYAPGTIRYQEIKAENVPAAITVFLNRDFFGYKVDKAYLGSDGNYKLCISKGDVKFNVLCKKNGELIRITGLSEEPDRK